MLAPLSGVNFVRDKVLKGLKTNIPGFLAGANSNSRLQAMGKKRVLDFASQGKNVLLTTFNFMNF
ncbi:MAG TPA: hypothetical protein PKX34_02050 [Candidatus Absconditabacterales bacterium]|nr:hypothetical protein [Candidatus Absconditabacterales bacterium]